MAIAFTFFVVRMKAKGPTKDLTIPQARHLATIGRRLRNAEIMHRDDWGQWRFYGDPEKDFHQLWLIAHGIGFDREGFQEVRYVLNGKPLNAAMSNHGLNGESVPLVMMVGQQQLEQILRQRYAPRIVRQANTEPGSLWMIQGIAPDFTAVRCDAA
ncbi:MAG: hypothetical protein Q7S89_03550 [bacterium]|nr:hypothetical protein [bacterium]